MVCKICNQKSKHLFSEKILKKYKIKYFLCDNCRFIQTEEPYWLEESYSNPNLMALDTGALQRNLVMSKKFSVLIYFLFNKDSSFIDFGGGCGVFTRLMRDLGFDFYLYDKYESNIMARGFEYKKQKNKFELVTSIECFEHLSDPVKEIESMLKISDNILFTTTIVPKPIPKPQNWFYYVFDHGQHISLYSLETLEFIAKKLSLNLCTNGENIHLFSRKKISNKYFNKLLKYTNKGLWWFVSKKLLSKGEFHWASIDHNFIKKQN